jgi:hypothetical protein
MSSSERTFYASENGDTWTLIAEGDRVSVRHAGNPSSGGHVTTHELGAFLIEEQHSPQNKALRALIATLATAPKGDDEAHPRFLANFGREA